MKRGLSIGCVLLCIICFHYQVAECITCLNCQNIDDLSNCKDVTVCKENETCFIEKVLSSETFEAVYNTGCKKLEYCRLQHCNKKAFGDGKSRRKRVPGEDLTLCSECCYEDSCNTKGCGYKHPQNNNTKCFSCPEVYAGGPSCLDTVDCDLKIFECSVALKPRTVHAGGAYELGCTYKRGQCKLLEGHDNNVKCCDTTLCNASPYNRKINKTAIALNFDCPTDIARPTTTPLPSTTEPPTTKPPLPVTPAPVLTPAPLPTKPSTLNPPQPPTKASTTTGGVPAKPPTKPTSSPSPSSTNSTVASLSTTAKITKGPTTNATTSKTPASLNITITQVTTGTTIQVTKATTTVTNAPSTLITNATTTVTNAPSTLITNATTIVTNAPSTQVTSATTISTNSPSTLITNASTTVTNSPSTLVTNATTIVTNAPSTQITNATTTVTNAPSTTVTNATTTVTPTHLTTDMTTQLQTTNATTQTQSTEVTTELTTLPSTTTSTAAAVSTSPPPKTLPPVTTTCAVCAGPKFLCEKLHAPTPCPPPNNYCINNITNHKDGTKTVDRRCGNFNTCYREWFQGTSDSDLCRKFDGNDEERLDFQCTYCCITDNCNAKLHPPENTLYKPV